MGSPLQARSSVKRREKHEPKEVGNEVVTGDRVYSYHFPGSYQVAGIVVDFATLVCRGNACRALNRCLDSQTPP